MQILIQQIDGWDTLTAEQIRNVLVTPDPQRRSESEATWATKGLLARMAPETVEALIVALRQAGYQATADALTATGLDFGHPTMQSRIEQLGQAAPDVFTPAIVADLQSLGIDARSPWQRANGDDPEPTVEQVAAAVQALTLGQYADSLAQRVTAAIRLSAAADGATEQAVRDAAIAEVG